MPIFKNHKPSPLLKGLSQTLTDDFKVFTDKNNVTRIQERKKRNTANASAAQLARQQVFQQASEYARLNSDNSFYVEEAPLRKLNAYQLAMADYMKTPSVAKVELVKSTTSGSLKLDLVISHCCLLADLKVTVKDNDDQTIVLVPEQSAQLADDEKNKYKIEFSETLLAGKTLVAVDLHLETVSGKTVDLLQKNISAVELNSSIYRP